ncbi:DUF4236 domain-containing protein [Acinetobacter modestus]|uniref:DUF4236 domain-containing protein n=1 Tax=Acinetobacter modestus TaxID=1776740 RepID=UPI00301894ED
MGFNFRKSFKIAPGIKINVTKKGISSLSLGKNGARVNVGKKGTKTTVSLPGSGISYSKFKRYSDGKTQPPPLPSSKDEESNSIGFGTLLLLGFILLFPIIWIFG